MQLFYTQDIEGDQARLGSEEARHCVQVLRKRPGDEIHFIDGLGTLYRAQIVEAGKKDCLLHILERQTDHQARSFHLQLAVAPTKQIDRFEWLLEKATEIGVDEIIPLLCQRSERRRIREDRLEKVILSAAKQSLKAQLPTLRPLTPFREALELTTSSERQRFIAWCEEDARPHLAAVYRAPQAVTIFIGPEGDFSKDEVTLARQHGFAAVSLGESRLRTETAGVVACHTLNLLNDLASISTSTA